MKNMTTIKNSMNAEKYEINKEHQSSRKKSSGMDAIYIMTKPVEKAMEWNKPLYM